MMLAKELGMSLSECNQKHTHREFMSWVAWFQEQMNIPSRSDFYMIQNTFHMIREIRGILGGRTDIKMDHLTLKFTAPDTEEKVVLTPEEKAKMSKASWMFAVGADTTQL